jgi:hypothetical protein
VSQAFRGDGGPVLVEAEVSGPAGRINVTLVLDTGATETLLSLSVLRLIGYDPDAAVDFARVATGSAVTMVPRITVNRLSALGKHAIGLQVLAHDLPPEAAVDGLLGLDFFRGHVLSIDFVADQIVLA